MISKFTNLFLYFLSMIYGLIVFIKNNLYELKLLKPKKTTLPVISVGNISVGGSGKTPVVIEILKLFSDLCVLTRGYKSEVTVYEKYPEFVLGSTQVKRFGDEPSMIKNRIEKASIVIDPNRFRGAEYALKNLTKLNGFVLDDGFQHRKLYRNLDIVVFDLYTYLNEKGLLPYGRFREPLNSLKRADVILLTKWQSFSELKINEIILKLKKYCNLIEKVDSKISSMRNHRGKLLSKGDVILVSGIGNPEVFEIDIKASFSDINIINHFKFEDHHNYVEADFDKINNLNPQAMIVCTEKDYIKIKNLNINLENIYYVFQEFVLPENIKGKIFNVYKNTSAS